MFFTSRLDLHMTAAVCWILLLSLFLSDVGSAAITVQGAGSTLAFPLYTEAALAYTFLTPTLRLVSMVLVFKAQPPMSLFHLRASDPEGASAASRATAQQKRAPLETGVFFDTHLTLGSISIATDPPKPIKSV